MGDARNPRARALLSTRVTPGLTPARRRFPALPLDRGTLTHLLGRAALLWLLVRCAYTGLSAARGQTIDGAPLAARVLLVGLVVLLCAIDGRASREPVFHANLGIGARMTLGVAAGVAIALELAAGVLLAAAT